MNAFPPDAAPQPPWVALPKGEVTGIDWSALGATEGRDPYLAWAEADRYRGFQLPPSSQVLQWLPLIVELTPDADVAELVRLSDPAWLMIPEAYLQLQGMRYCTARAQRGFFAALQKPGRLSQIVLRYELGMPVDKVAGTLSHYAQLPKSTGSEPWFEPLRGAVLGLIDGGLAFANQDFLDDADRPRVKYFWRQDEHEGNQRRGVLGQRLELPRAGEIPASMGYGRELTGRDIADQMRAHTRNGAVDEDALYQHFQLGDLGLQANHGTHVMSLASGKTSYIQSIADENQTLDLSQQDDAASRCDLIAVQLNWSNVLDTSGGSMNVSVLDGLMYMLSRCADDARLVVNISWGTLAGPHDGSSILEAAMDQLIELRGGKLDIVVPAGNGYQSRTHANALMEPGDSLDLNWHLQPDDHSQSFLELWFADPEEATIPLVDLCIHVHPPGLAEALPPVCIGHAGVWPNAASPVCGLIFPKRSALGRSGTCALLALAPTASFESDTPTAQPGIWRVTISNQGLNLVVLDGYIERDDVAMGTHTGARQSWFEDDNYDSSGGLGSFVDDRNSQTPIRRSGTFNSLSTGKRTMVSGGIRLSQPDLAKSAALLRGSNVVARYSPRDPDPVPRTQRPGVKSKPDHTQITDESPALWGVRGAASRSGGVTRMVGTSSGAPQLARQRLNAAHQSFEASASQAS